MCRTHYAACRLCVCFIPRAHTGRDTINRKGMYAVAVIRKFDTASIRLNKADGKGVRTITRVNPVLTPANVTSLMTGFNALRTEPVDSAAHTVRNELVRQP